MKAFGWNIDQILVYIWQCLSSEQSEQEYPYSKFENSEMGQRLRLELEALNTKSALFWMACLMTQALSSAIEERQCALDTCKEMQP